MSIIVVKNKVSGGSPPPAEDYDTPVGGIELWYGTSGTVPEGWQICNGSGGTPDLTTGFVLGATDDTDLGDTGGSASHTHTGGSSVVDGSHSHTFSGSIANASGGTGGGTGTIWWTYYTSSTHGHSVTGTSCGSTGNHTHAGTTTGGSSVSRPPHKRLYFIKRLV